nr:UPF0481 protein At3g47200-like [Quercus suber]XP_023890152.1 UPF0481 protein At3g47200-like [Quercus suber]POE63883.1 upf0481 protein [Quercus suber]
MTESASTKIQDQNTQKEADIPSGNEKKNDELVIEIREIVKRPEIRSSTRCRIHKVPHHLRKWNEVAYTPQVVSIGPIHHNDERLKSMEEYKERYFRSFVKRSKIKVEYFVNTIRRMEKSIRRCYAETICPTSGKFVKMILVDAIFILELFIKETSGIQTRDDPMIAKTRAKAMKFDLLLLENQLPFFVIKKLHQLAFRSLCKSDPRLLNCDDLVQLSLKYFWDPCFKFSGGHRNAKVKHFTDLLRIFQLPPPESRPKRGNQQILWYTATQLHEAGVMFMVAKSSESESPFDIKFEKGVFKIPQLLLNHWTEVVTRNITALEQTHHIKDTYFTDYLFLMDSLINTREDVDLLCDKKILVNYLGDNNAAMSMIDNLNKGIVWETVRDDYINLWAELKSFYEQRPQHRWWAKLKHEFFSTPSAAASTIFTIFIITVLTFIQTICSILEVTGSS